MRLHFDLWLFMPDGVDAAMGHSQGLLTMNSDLLFHACRLSAALLLACTLTACGGGGGGFFNLPGGTASVPDAPPTPPDATPKPVVRCAPAP